MKALSLWQPWASAIALGSKRIETRSWPTDYRGPLAIHAAKRCIKSELEDTDAEELWQGALHRTRAIPGLLPLWNCIPFGAIVAVCRLVDCRRTESFGDEIREPRGARPYYWTEEDMGDFYPGRWGWVLEDVRAIEPVPWRGAQGLFEVPDEVLRDAYSNAIR